MAWGMHTPETVWQSLWGHILWSFRRSIRQLWSGSAWRFGLLVDVEVIKKFFGMVCSSPLAWR